MFYDTQEDKNTNLLDRTYCIYIACYKEDDYEEDDDDDEQNYLI